MNPPVIERRPPGFLWAVLPAATGFVTGFFGPMIFNPDSNLGPVVGLLFTGPAGAALGLLLWAAFRFLPLSAKTQWRALTALCVAGGLAVLAMVQPDPAELGDVLELEVIQQRPPSALADRAVADWRQRFIEFPQSQTRPAWEAKLRATLASDRGAVLEAVVLRQRSITRARKPWNFGRLAAGTWATNGETLSFYFAPGVLTTTPSPRERLTFFRPNDTLDGINVPDTWPPVEPERILGLSSLVTVPPRYDGL